MRRFALAVVLVGGWLAAGVAIAQNMLVNPDFASTVNGWAAEYEVSVAWSPIDVVGSSESGSAEVVNARSGPRQGGGISQCVAAAIVAGAEYDYGGSAFIPTDQSRTGEAQIGLRWYDGPGCTGAYLTPQPRIETGVVGAWVELGASRVVAPAGAVSVLFLAFPSKIEEGGSLTGHFDDLYLMPTPIFADGFEMGSTSEWTSTIMVFVTQSPYFDSDQIEYAGRTFCEDGSCPWGPGMHDGIDFVTDTNLVPFRSACDGTVSTVSSFVTGFGHRQVTVIIELEGNPGFGLVYAFEPMIQDVAGQQEANIVVSQGDEISAGDLIGRLVMSPAVGSHVHWGVLANHQQVCPRPYLADAVESSLLDLIREDEPAGEICY